MCIFSTRTQLKAPPANVFFNGVGVFNGEQILSRNALNLRAWRIVWQCKAYNIKKIIYAFDHDNVCICVWACSTAIPAFCINECLTSMNASQGVAVQVILMVGPATMRGRRKRAVTAR
jgi:prenyltransferase beta subunit